MVREWCNLSNMLDWLQYGKGWEVASLRIGGKLESGPKSYNSNILSCKLCDVGAIPTLGLKDRLNSLTEKHSFDKRKTEGASPS